MNLHAFKCMKLMPHPFVIHSNQIQAIWHHSKLIRHPLKIKSMASNVWGALEMRLLHFLLHNAYNGTRKARTRDWGRRPRKKICVDSGMANGREDDRFLFRRSLEFVWSVSCVIVCWNVFWDGWTPPLPMLGLVLMPLRSVYEHLTATVKSNITNIQTR